MEKLINNIINYWEAGNSYNDSIKKACNNLSPEEKKKIIKEIKELEKENE